MRWAGLCNDFDSVVVWIQWIIQWIFGPLDLLTIVFLFHNYRCKKRQIYIVLLFSLQDAANFLGHAQIHRNRKRKHCASAVCYQDSANNTVVKYHWYIVVICKCDNITARICFAKQCTLIMLFISEMITITPFLFPLVEVNEQWEYIWAEMPLLPKLWLISRFTHWVVPVFLDILVCKFVVSIVVCLFGI